MQAEHTLFRVHRGILLLHSPACQDILTMPSGVPNDGVLDDHPVKLEGITLAEFEQFCAWMYHM